MSLRSVGFNVDEWLTERGLRPMGDGLPAEEAEAPESVEPPAPGIDPIRLRALLIAADIAGHWPVTAADRVVPLAEQFLRFLAGETAEE